MPGGSFLCLCLYKGIKVRDDVEGLVPRYKDEQETRQRLDEADLGGDSKMVLTLPGGGIAARGLGLDPELAMEGPLLAVVSGTITNYAYLIRKYFVEELGYARNVSLESIRQATPIRDAALLCRLYDLLGTGMLPKLRGPFCFCLYDSSTMRVLAARDPTCTEVLLEGITKEGDLFIASGGYKPEGASSAVEILPGRFKYGWRAPARKYANPQQLVDTSAAAAASAALAALSGIKVSGKGKDGTIKEESGEGKRVGKNVAFLPEGPKLKTKKELRAWGAHVAQEAIKEYESGADVNAVSVFGDPIARNLPLPDRRTGTNLYGNGGAGMWVRNHNNFEAQGNHYRGSHLSVTERVIGQSQFKPQVLAALLGMNADSESSSMGSAKNPSQTSRDDVNSSLGQSSSDSGMTTSESASTLCEEPPSKFASVPPAPKKSDLCHKNLLHNQ